MRPIFTYAFWLSRLLLIITLGLWFGGKPAGRRKSGKNRGAARLLLRILSRALH